jgi:HSP20 family protein
MVEKRAKKESREVEPYTGRGILGAFDEMDRLFGRFMGRPFGPSWLPRLRWPEDVEVSFPDVDIFEDDNEVVLKAELPGVSKEDLEVDVTEDAITISGEKKKEEKVERKDYYRLERSFGSFSRSFSLPAGVQSSDARASFKDGVLEIKVPKKEEARKKKIKVTVE